MRAFFQRNTETTPPSKEIPKLWIPIPENSDRYDKTPKPLLKK